MKFFHKIVILILVAIMVLIPICNKPQEPVEDDPQYVVFMITNKRCTELEPYIVEMIELHGEIDPTSKRMYAFGVPGPMCLTQSIEEMNEQVNYAFMLAEKYNVPVYFQMDDCTNYTDYFGYGATIDEYGNKFFNDPEMWRAKNGAASPTEDFLVGTVTGAEYLFRLQAVSRASTLKNI